MIAPLTTMRPLPPPSLQRGVSLIELMVAIAISMILLAAVASVITSTNEGYRELHRSNEQAENGRVALQLLGDDLQHAGFYGTEFNFADLAAPTATAPDPCSTDPADIEDGLALPLYGYNDITTTSTLPSCIPAAQLLDNTDILVIRRTGTVKTDTNDNHLIDTGELEIGAYYLQSDNNEHRLNKGTDDTALDSDHFDLTKRDAATKAEIRPYKVFIYYVARCNVCSGGGDGIPTLKRQELSYSGGAPVMTETPLVEGIEQLQITYGVDPDIYTDKAPNVNWGAANYYQTANNLNNVSPAATTLARWRDVVSVRLDIVARNRAPTAGYQDAKSYTLSGYGAWSPAATVRNIKRRAYTMTVRMENFTGARER